MYEFHGWIRLSDSTYESEREVLERGVDEVRREIDAITWTTAGFDIVAYNWGYFLRLTGLMLRNRGESDRIDELLALIADRLPGSYGLVYDRSDEGDMPTPPGPGAFRVRVLARGKLVERLDPFLSPVQPTIED